MKKLVTIIFILITHCTYVQSQHVFIPKNNIYVKKVIKVKEMSINNIANYLGYNKDEYYFYFNYKKKEEKISAVLLKSFTDSIICVITDESLLDLISNRIDNYMVDFNYDEEFGASQIESTLEDGVKNKSLTYSFLCRVLGVKKTANGINSNFISNKIGYKLFFKNGILINYTSSDGLNKWAKDWKNSYPDTYKNYYDEAKIYHGSDEKAIIDEINIQADAFASVPSAYSNEYIGFHYTKQGNVNFKMILIAHYNDKVNIDEFKKINFGRYELIKEYTENNYKRTTYLVNKTLCTFDEAGKLLDTYTTE